MEIETRERGKTAPGHKNGAAAVINQACFQNSTHTAIKIMGATRLVDSKKWIGTLAPRRDM